MTKNSKISKMSEQPKPDMGLLEEDDEFEEFPAEDTMVEGRRSQLHTSGERGVSATDVQLSQDQELHPPLPSATDTGVRPNDGCFLETDELINLLLEGGAPIIKHIVDGPKEDVYMLVDCPDLLEQRTRGKKRNFRDDCGFYDQQSNRLKTAYFVSRSSGEFSYIQKCQGVFVSGSKKIPLEPQPLESEVYILRRYYSSLEHSTDYKRRISWLEKVPSSRVFWSIFCAEYIGKFPSKDSVSLQENMESAGSAWTGEVLRSQLHDIDTQRETDVSNDNVDLHPSQDQEIVPPALPSATVPGVSPHCSGKPEDPPSPSATVPGVYPNGGKFLKSEDVISLLLTPGVPVLNQIVDGPKKDVYMVVDCPHIFQHRIWGRNRHFRDDCGAYERKSVSNKAGYYLPRESGQILHLKKKHGVFVSGVKKIPLEPQPLESELYILRRYYAALKRSPSFKRKVSWLQQLPSSMSMPLRSIFCAEYVGKCSQKDLKSFKSNVKSAGSASTGDSDVDQQLSQEQDICPCPSATIPGVLPNLGKFLETNVVMKLLLTGAPSINQIVDGPKEDIYMLVDCPDMFERWTRGKKRNFKDDCGVYDQKSTSLKTAYFVSRSPGEYSHIKTCQGLFVSGRKRTPLEPQPLETDMYVLRRYYTSLKHTPDCKRRISWLEKVPSPHVLWSCICVEYIGKFPAKASMSVQGNAKSTGTDWTEDEQTSLLQTKGERDISDIDQQLSEDQELCPPLPVPGVLPNRGRFLGTDEVINLLLTGGAPIIKQIVDGPKEDVYMLVESPDLCENQINRKKRNFQDDCGAYDQKLNSLKTSYFVFRTPEEFAHIHKCEDVFVSGSKKIPLEPQPLESEVFILRRYYTTLKRSTGYKRRISWLENVPSSRELWSIFCAEYIGSFPPMDSVSLQENVESAGSAWAGDVQRSPLHTQEERGIAEIDLQLSQDQIMSLLLTGSPGTKQMVIQSRHSGLRVRLRDWAQEEEDATDVNVWEDNWDDDNIEDDFSKQLRAELEKQGKNSDGTEQMKS